MARENESKKNGEMQKNQGEAEKKEKNAGDRLKDETMNNGLGRNTRGPQLGTPSRDTI